DGLLVYGLKELETGRPPHFGTSFRLAWADDALYLGILCKDRDTKSLRIGAKEHGDTNIWSGDAVEILLETQSHCYYQIAISPAGAVVDLDRKQGLNILWSSGAEVASHIGDDFWSLEVRIPAAGDMAGELDPLNGVAGRKPHTTYPWFFNVCRQRAGDQGKELSAFSPTGKPNFHDPMKFAELTVP
ncbi:MAG: hypothetical protein FJ272_14950, partial [Planctomycetes bacterium]|nr:hypothetical protein [Planctomycetota bacterium]